MEGKYFEINLSGWQMRVRAGDAHYMHRYLWGGGRHSHGEYELHIVLSGKAQIEVGKEKYWLQTGDAMVIAPGMYHQPRAEQTEIERFSMQIIVPDGPLSEKLEREVQGCRVFSASKSLCQLCSDYYYETSAVNPYRLERQNALLTLLLIGIFRELGAGQTVQNEETSTSPLQRKILIDTFFGVNFSTDAKLEDLAEALHISPRQLSRFLLKHYGMNYRELLIRARMDQAAWLLRTTEQPIPKVAASVGYKSESAFYKVFFNQYKQTPRQYRQENNGEQGEQI